MAHWTDRLRPPRERIPVRDYHDAPDVITCGYCGDRPVVDDEDRCQPCSEAKAEKDADTLTPPSTPPTATAFCPDCEDEPVVATGQKCAGCLALDEEEKPKPRCAECRTTLVEKAGDYCSDNCKSDSAHYFYADDHESVPGEGR